MRSSASRQASVSSALVSSVFNVLGGKLSVSTSYVYHRTLVDHCIASLVYIWGSIGIRLCLDCVSIAFVCTGGM